ncbi:hypothetical protein PG985_001028 [Apiospora marii]|uniref:F-box domain-containing protein n=1 Tax=Apiospora marii TaxID=335849 RepID=A0ABR1RIU1_9PEZI
MSVNGPWSRQCVCTNGGWSYPEIVLDTHGLLEPPDLPARQNESRTGKTRKRKQPDRPKPDTSSATGKHANPQGLLGSLPPELLQQVLRELFPDGLSTSTGCATQFFSARQANKPIQIVHQMMPFPKGYHKDMMVPIPNKPGAGGLGLAQTSRYWHNFIYSSLYGQNAFVFNVGITTHEVRIESRDFGSWHSWMRALTPPPNGEMPGPLGPVTGRAAKWLRNVTLVIACPTSHGAREISQLEAEVRRAVEVLRECERLETLQLCLQVCERADKRFDTLRIDLLDASLAVEEDSSRRYMKVEIRDPVVQEPTRMNKVQRAFEPLLELENVAQKVVINGLMLREFYDELSRTLSADGGDGLGPEKLFSAQGERIATGRNAVLHGHIPRPQ